MASSADDAGRRQSRLRFGRSALALGGPALLAAALAGCVSTEEKASWSHIQDARIIASQKPTIVTRAGDQVRVTDVALLRSAGRVAIVVTLRNTTSRAVNDIPISVGLRGRRGRRVYLNRSAGLDYFKTHVAVIAARGSVTWVYTGRAKGSFTGRAFAIAGRESVPPVTIARTIPQLAALATAQQASSGSLRLTVTNRSSVPQVELPVYALAGHSGHYSAAGAATVANLGSGETAHARLDLIGRPQGAQVQLEALPTLF